MVLRVVVGGSTSGDGLANHFIDICSTLARQAHEDFRALCRIANVFWSERLELFVSKQHHVDVFTHYHASGRLVRELSIKAESEFLKEFCGLAEVLDGQIDVYFGGHVDAC